MDAVTRAGPIQHRLQEAHFGLRQPRPGGDAFGVEQTLDLGPDALDPGQVVARRRLLGRRRAGRRRVGERRGSRSVGRGFARLELAAARLELLAARLELGPRPGKLAAATFEIFARSRRFGGRGAGVPAPAAGG